MTDSLEELDQREQVYLEFTEDYQRTHEDVLVPVLVLQARPLSGGGEPLPAIRLLPTHMRRLRDWLEYRPPLPLTLPGAVLVMDLVFDQVRIVYGESLAVWLDFGNEGRAEKAKAEAEVIAALDYLLAAL